MKRLKKVFPILALAGLLGFSSCSDKSGSKGYEYLAVQLESGTNWSIMDGSGKVVVKEEYLPSCVISEIDDGTYWVQNGDKFMMYSVQSPKQPVIDEEFEGVTLFEEGLAFVSKLNQPIKMIDTDGKVVAELPEDIVRVHSFTEGRAQFKSKNGAIGYLDKKGNVAIKAIYEEGEHFFEGLALVKEKGGEDWLIIDKDGKLQGKINSKKYEVVKLSFFGDGMLAVLLVNDNSDGYSVTFVDKTGKEVLKPFKLKSRPSGIVFEDGYCRLDDGGNCWVINTKGEKVIREGKYMALRNMGKGHFCAWKGDKWGVIDKDDNVIVDFDYKSASYSMLGDNYIMSTGSYFLLVDPSGNEIKNTDFERAYVASYFNVNYVNVKSIAADLLEGITPSGYKAFNGKTTADEIARLYSKDVSDVVSTRRSGYADRFDIPAPNVGEWDVRAYVEFDAPVVYRPEIIRVVNDGWFAHQEKSYEEPTWNPKSVLNGVVIRLKYDKIITFNQLLEAIGNELASKGFEQEGEIFEAKNGDKYARVQLYSKSDTELEVCFYPFFINSIADEMD
ncbi:MAG: WG repeat-containing protein [Bacteroides sp.]|nr:WG repeat-containing protein [Bacteroides sp.]